MKGTEIGTTICILKLAYGTWLEILENLVHTCPGVNFTKLRYRALCVGTYASLSLQYLFDKSCHYRYQKFKKSSW